MRWIAFLGLVLMTVGCRSTSELEVVTGFNLDRYLGTWCELARFPHGFEEGLSRVTAEYALRKDGKIRVLNKGFNEKTGKWETAEGTAVFKGDRDRGWLKVSFFGPFYASYKIIHLSDDYSRAIVTGPTYDYLWILARSPELPDNELQELVDKAGSFGFQTNQIIRVSHEPLPDP